MFGMIANLFVVPFVVVWLRIFARPSTQGPTPGERPSAFAAGPNADRVLLVGSAAAVGFGVTSAGIALGGHLARSLSSLTARGTSIETVARVGMRVREVAAVLLEFRLDRFDAVVMTVGSVEALRLVSLRQFRAEVTELLNGIDATAPAPLGVVVLGVPDITSVIRVPRVFQPTLRRHCLQLDRAMKQVCGQHDRVTYLPFAPVSSDLDRGTGRQRYSAWAALIAPTVARVLDVQVTDPRDPATIQEVRRQSALDALHVLDTPAEPRFDQIVADARNLFGVAGASITFIDRDRQWSKASLGMGSTDSPRGSALGDATVQNGKLLVVEDAAADDLFRGHPWVAGSTAIRFFAGFPIEAANGERIGALCITDPIPRSFSPAEDALLGMLAKRVQTELWGD